MRRTTPLGFDWWAAYVTLESEGAWTFRVEGWSDPWETWVHNAEIKIPAGIDVALVCTEGNALFHGAAQRARQAGDPRPRRSSAGRRTRLDPAQQVEDRLRRRARCRGAGGHGRFGPRELVSPTPDYPIFVDRQRALFSSWYEFFPAPRARRDEQSEWVSGTFDTSHERLEAARRWASTSSTCRRSTRSAPASARAPTTR